MYSLLHFDASPRSFAADRAVFLPREDHCAQISFTTTSDWTLKFYQTGAAVLTHAASFTVHRLPAGTFDFTRLHREVLRLSQTAVSSGSAFHVTVLANEEARRPLEARSYAFSSADTTRLKALFEDALSAPTHHRWAELDGYLARHPLFPMAAA